MIDTRAWSLLGFAPEQVQRRVRIDEMEYTDIKDVLMFPKSCLGCQCTQSLDPAWLSHGTSLRACHQCTPPGGSKTSLPRCLNIQRGPLRKSSAPPPVLSARGTVPARAAGGRRAGLWPPPRGGWASQVGYSLSNQSIASTIHSFTSRPASKPTHRHRPLCRLVANARAPQPTTPSST